MDCKLTLYQGDNWNDLLKEVVTFDSVEEFWGVYVRSPNLDESCGLKADFITRTTSHLHQSLP